jgi:hypothetical protein
LRTTADPAFFGTERPQRERPRELPKAKITRHRPANRFPFFWQTVKSCRFRRRDSLGNRSPEEGSIRP